MAESPAMYKLHDDRRCLYSFMMLVYLRLTFGKGQKEGEIEESVLEGVQGEKETRKA